MVNIYNPFTSFGPMIANVGECVTSPLEGLGGGYVELRASVTGAGLA